MPRRVRDLANVHKGGAYTFTYAEGKSSDELWVYDVDAVVEGQGVHVTVPVKTGDNLGLHITPNRADWGRFHIAFDNRWNEPFGAENMPSKEGGEALAWYDDASAVLEAIAVDFLNADAGDEPENPENTAANDNAPVQYEYAMQGYPQIPQIPQHGGYDPYGAQYQVGYDPYAAQQYGYDQNPMYAQQPYVEQPYVQPYVQQPYVQPYVQQQYVQQPYGAFDQSGLFIPPQPPQQPVQAQPVNLNGQAVAGVFLPGVGMVYRGPVSYGDMMYGTGLVVQADGRPRSATQTEVAQAHGH